MADRVCMALIENDRILLVQQHYRGDVVWTLPGGGLEQGETQIEAVIREIKEETNLKTRVKHLLYQTPRTKGDGNYYCYLGEITAGEVALGSDPELIDIAWFSLSDLQNHPEVSRLLPYL